MARYVIGDIQGCFDEFQTLLQSCAIGHDDELWLVGDLVNRGPKNLETLKYLMSRPNLRIVLGNHDLHLLAIAHHVKAPSRSDTIDDILAAPERDEIIDWLRRQPLIQVDAAAEFVMTHAGLPPNWSLATCIERASEVSRVLASDDYVSFLTQMYGDQPDAWSDDLTGADRLRVITNYFTRLRYCTAEGRLELTSKTDVTPAGFKPWFKFPRPGNESFRILFGHWAALGGETGDDRFVALDTGCVWGHKLTAYRMDDGALFSTPSQYKTSNSHQNR